MAELVVRLHALCRRHQHTHTLNIDDLVLNLVTHQASRGGKRLTLSAKEWVLLLALARKSPEVMSREHQGGGSREGDRALFPVAYGAHARFGLW